MRSGIYKALQGSKEGQLNLADEELRSSVLFFSLATETWRNLERDLEDMREYYRNGKTEEASWRKSQLKGLLILLREKEGDIFKALKQDLGKHHVKAFRDEIGTLTKIVNTALESLKDWMSSKTVTCMDGALEHMCQFGFCDQLVRELVKELLKVYGNDGWYFFESDSYKVLLDALLEKQKKMVSKGRTLLFVAADPPVARFTWTGWESIHPLWGVQTRRRAARPRRPCYRWISSNKEQGPMHGTKEPFPKDIARFLLQMDGRRKRKTKWDVRLEDM
ncbi:hypothetical protein CMV_002053 [Castanea mollissima]|uniref:WIYLD domain-containing protein n=1 Tax=Castanea mollissima TaxID=60419 RepID=A0A8J4VXU5_9ROSI|nr:hypothetical protein CMV_002053 [Castanea mollissima]